MAALSDYLEQGYLEHLFGIATLAQPAAFYIGLYTTATDDAGGGTEVVGNGYARQAVTFGTVQSDATSHFIANTALVQFVAAGGNWGTITHTRLLDAATGGNSLYHGPIAADQVVNDGGKFEYGIGAFIVRNR